MATAAQLQANRANAQLSTGPRTPEGKERARYNSRKHGLLAEKLVADPADVKEFCLFYFDMHRDLDAEGRLEEMLAERVISLAWRLTRAGKIEREVLLQGMNWARQQSEHCQLGRAFRWDCEGTEALSKLTRYEGHLQRSLFKTLHELERLQARRRGAHVPPPAVLDVQLDVVAAK